MKRLVCITALWSLLQNAEGQTRTYTFYQLYQLDSIGHSSSPGSHFGDLYYHFLLLVEKKLLNADTTTRRLVRHFEQVFAQYYIDACYAYKENREIPLPAWRFYFRDSTLSRAQYYLLGANAHLNGGLAEAIADSYTPQEWKKLRKEYVLFNSCLNETLQKVYRETLLSSGHARTLSILSLGLTGPLSRYYLYKWRKRQMRLTGYFFERSPRYEKLMKKVKLKKDKLDRMIIENIR